MILKININDFKTSPFALPLSTVYSFNETNDQFDTLNKLILSVIDKHAPLVKTKFARPPAPWMKGIKINNLQRDRDHWRYAAQKFNRRKLEKLQRVQKQNQKIDQRKENSILQRSCIFKKQQRNLESNSSYS